MTEPIRYQDEQGNAYMWEAPNGDESFVIDEDDRCVVIDSPYGSPRTTDLAISFAAFKAGIGHDAVRARFGELALQEILHELSLPQKAGTVRTARRQRTRSILKSPRLRTAGAVGRLR